MNLCKINRFRIHFTNRKPLYMSINNLYIIQHYIYQYGYSIIRKIIFYFTNSHILTLECHNSMFFVVFYHYYNGLNTLVGSSLEQQIIEYLTVLHYIYYTLQLKHYIIEYIVFPFSVEILQYVLQINEHMRHKILQ